MRITRSASLLALLLGIAACGGGGGGGGGGPPTGSPYGYLNWTSDITAADFTNIGVPNPFYSNTRYPLKAGTGRVLWQSNWLGCCINYYLDVTIEGGTPGNDRIYTATISGDTLYYSNGLTPMSTGSLQPLQADGSAEAMQRGDAQSDAQEGRASGG